MLIDHNRKDLILTYENANSVRDFHVPLDYKLGLTKSIFQLITLEPYSKHECRISWNKQKEPN